MAQCSTIPTESILFLIEQFLLPAADDHYLPANMKKRRNVCTSPTARLDHILYQVALADHIRMTQIMYRDSEDDLCLASELRVGDISIKLPTKHLIQKITEGRSRILALSRCCYEENSYETLRALVDLTSSYALQGMWPQVSENVAQVSHLLSLKDTMSDSDDEKQRLRKQNGKRSAHKVNCCYKLLRTHAILYRGYISASFVKELEIGLSPPSHADSIAKTVTRTDESSVPGADNVTELMEELRILFKVKLLNTLDSNRNSYEDDADNRCKDLRLSWGDVVNFFREDSVVMQKWMDDVEGSLLPQNVAALHLPFRTCDEQRKGIAHPIQLCEAFMRFSNALKVIAGSTLLKQLRNLDIAMPILIDRKNGNTCTVKEWDANGKTIETISCFLLSNRLQLSPLFCGFNQC
jgi:hypothetical protein